jgi:sulfur-oxidizing protein SoxX
MRKPGSRRSLPKSSAEAAGAALALALAGVACLTPAQGETLRPYEIVGDAIPSSLTGARGDPARGRAIVASRQTGLCLLCHSGPFPEERFQGNLAPDLAGAGARWSEGQLRLRMVDSTRINPATIMPSYYRIDGLTRVGRPWQGKPVLTAEQIEDVVAFLANLRG